MANFRGSRCFWSPIRLGPCPNASASPLPCSANTSGWCDFQLIIASTKLLIEIFEKTPPIFWKWVTQKNTQKENMLERSRKRNDKNISAWCQFSYFQILSGIHGGLGLKFTQCFWLQGLIPKQHILEAEKGPPFSKEEHLQSITNYQVLGSISVFGKVCWQNPAAVDSNIRVLMISVVHYTPVV